MNRLFVTGISLAISFVNLIAAEPTTPPSGPTLTPYGAVAYRFREEIIRNSSSDGDTIKKAANYLNMLGYKIGAKIAVNDQISMQFEIGNDWNATENVNSASGNFMTRRSLTPYFSQANAQWDPGFMHVAGGILYVKGSPLMDLIGASIFKTTTPGGPSNLKTYSFAAHNTWGTLTNFNLPGLRMGAPIVKGDFSLGVDLLTSIVEERTVTPTIDSLFIDSYSSIMFILDIPIKFGAVTLNPQFVPIFNRSFLDSIGKKGRRSNPELGFGIDGVCKIGEVASIRGGFGFAMLSNKYSHLPADALQNRRGLNINLGTTIKAGPGKIDVDGNYSFDKNAEDDNSLTNYSFMDLRYGWIVYKGFTLTPRTRLFISSTEHTLNLKTRPEIILSWAF